MREFILLNLKARTSPDFSMGELPQAGRMDLVCRAVSNAFYTSKHLRTDTVFHACFNGPRNPPKIVSFYGNELRGMEPDEKSIGMIIRNALKKGIRMKMGDNSRVSDGLSISMKSFESLIKEKKELYYLHAKGEDIRNVSFGENPCFVLGDYIGLPRKTEGLLDRLGAKRISLGPVELFASHCPILVHNELDRQEFHNP